MPSYRFTPKPKSNLFDHLAKYRIILVTGPHRSGSTIAAAMIANDLGYEFMEDVNEHLDSLMAAFSAKMFLEATVIHCPSQCHSIHAYANIDGVAGVIVVRDVDDIIKSERRIPWAFEGQQLNEYRFKARPRPSFAVQSPIAMVKYRYWQEVQKPLFGVNGYEVRYEDLKTHPMWLSDEQRQGFTANQLEIGKQHGPKVQGRRLPVGIEGKVVKK